MKRWMHAVWAAVLGASLAANAWGAGWQPDKNVELIVGTAPGGALDVTARQLAKIFETDHLVPKPVTVVNRPGAGSSLAWTYLNQQAGDGNFLSISATPLLANSIVGTNPITYTSVTPLAILFSEYIACSVRADSPFHNGKELIDRLRKDPGSISISIASSRGATNHIAAGTVFQAAGIDLKKLKFVVFRSSAESLTGLIGGHVDVDFSTVSNVLGHLQAGRIRVLGVTAPHRMTGPMAKVPTWTEQGYPVDFSGWRGVIGPKDLSAAQVAYWDSVFARLSKSKDWHAVLAKRLWANTYMDSAQTRKFLKAQNEDMKKVLAGLGLAK